MDMSANSSSNSSIHPPFLSCHKKSIFIITAQLVIYILFLLPLFLLVLYLGYQRWKKRRSSSQAVINSHMDVITFNMVTLELFGMFGTSVFCYGIYCNQSNTITVGLYIFTIVSPAQTLFHLLACVDRYLAVVHPIIYMSLRQSGGVRIRNVIIGCVWLLCITSPGSTLVPNFHTISNILLLTFCSVVASFCSISVLCVLIHPQPGEVGGNRERVDQSKQRAFHNIMAITGALLSRFLTMLVYETLLASLMISYNDVCSAMSTLVWFCLPSSLVLPLLFLHRAGKLPCSK